MPIDKGTSKPITQLSSLQINYKDEYSCFNPPIVTTEEREDLVNTDDPKNPIKDGTLIFNSDSGYAEYYSANHGDWIQIKEGGGGTGDVTGPKNAKDNNIAVFDGTTGKVIKDSGVSTDLVVSASSASVTKDQIPVWYSATAGKISIANSGVTVDKIKQKNARKNVNATELYQLSNLGALQFGNNDNVADTGVILVDGLTPVTFQTQGTGADSRVCTVINGELGEGSSSPSALLEINSTEGGFLHARMTTAQRDSLLDPKDGLEIYNTDTKNLNIRQDGSWVEIKSGENGNVVGPSASTINGLAIWGDGAGTTLTSPSQVMVGYSISNNADLYVKGSFGQVELHSQGYPPTDFNSRPQISFVSFGHRIDLRCSSSLTQDIIFTFPYLMPIDGQILSGNANGNTSWVSKNQLTYSKFNDETNDLKIVSKDKHIVGVNTASKEQRIVLDKLSSEDQGHYFIIKDETGNASKNNIIVEGNEVLIDGEEQYIINVDYGCITVCYTGSSWAIIGFYCTKG